MTPELALEIFLDALKDSALVFAFVFLMHILLSLFDTKFASFLTRRKRSGPVFGSLFGLIPQCGTSVLGADLYIKRYITIGTLIAIFLSCSDEAFIAILTSGSSRTWMILPLIGLKIGIGIAFGYLVDLIFRHQELEEIKEDEHIEELDCPEHHHHHESKVHKHLLHPLFHALEIFGYVFAINLALGYLIGFIGEDNFMAFLQSNKYLTPLYASIIGLIPNCASSLLITELFVENAISFGALLAGFLVNSGLGMMMLLKNRRGIKNLFFIILICFTVALISGYITCLIVGF